jgi:predicted CoA-binding protein
MSENNSKLARLNYSTMKLSHLKRKVMTVTNIAYMLAKLMKHHIGIGNAISMEDLFKAIYQRERKPDYVDDFRWDYVRKAMHRLRQSDKLFIVSVKDESNVYSYFVPTTLDEANVYVTALENNIKRQRAMQQKVVKSVNEGWYKLDWVAESKTLSAYEEALETKPAQKQINMKSSKTMMRR